MGDKLIDETGNTYGKLEVIGLSHVKRYKSGIKQSYWLCRCSCGVEKPIRAGDLRRSGPKAARSCGQCVKVKHGHAAASGQSPEYVSWHSMINRCTLDYECNKGYVGSGITVCDRWLNSFEAFLEDMGLKPTLEHTIDRIDGTKGYEPGNCRWATMHEQTRNMRTNKWITINGQTKILADWRKEFGVSLGTYYHRIRAGLSEVDALTRPRQVGKRL